MPAALGCVGHPLRDNARFGPDRGQWLLVPGHLDPLQIGHGLQLFGVDHRALPGQRDRAAGVAGATATRNDGQTQFHAALHQPRHLHLGIGREYHKRVFHPPVGGVGHMRHPREAVKLDVVFGGQAAQQLGGALAQRGDLLKGFRETINRNGGSRQQLAHAGIARRVVLRRAALLHLAQAVVQSLHQGRAALGVVQQVVLQIRVALHHPNITQHLVQHARRTAGSALTAQLVEQCPGALAEQPQNNFAVGK